MDEVEDIEEFEIFSPELESAAAKIQKWFRKNRAKNNFRNVIQQALKQVGSKDSTSCCVM